MKKIISIVVMLLYICFSSSCSNNPQMDTGLSCVSYSNDDYMVDVPNNSYIVSKPDSLIIKSSYEIQITKEKCPGSLFKDINSIKEYVNKFLADTKSLKGLSPNIEEVITAYSPSLRLTIVKDDKKQINYYFPMNNFCYVVSSTLANDNTLWNNVISNIETFYPTKSIVKDDPEDNIFEYPDYTIEYREFDYIKTLANTLIDDGIKNYSLPKSWKVITPKTYSCTLSDGNTSMNIALVKLIKGDYQSVFETIFSKRKSTDSSLTRKKVTFNGKLFDIMSSNQSGYTIDPISKTFIENKSLILLNIYHKIDNMNYFEITGLYENNLTEEVKNILGSLSID